MSPGSPDIVTFTQLTWIVGGISAAYSALLLLLYNYQRTENRDLWSKLNEQGEKLRVHEIAVARDYSTKNDLDVLGERIERRIDEFQRQVLERLDQRRSARGGD